MSPDRRVRRRLLLSYGVEPLPPSDAAPGWNAFVRSWMEEEGLAGPLAVLVEGPSTQDPDAGYRMELLDFGA